MTTCTVKGTVTAEDGLLMHGRFAVRATPPEADEHFAPVLSQPIRFDSGNRSPEYSVQVPTGSPFLLKVVRVRDVDNGGYVPAGVMRGHVRTECNVDTTTIELHCGTARGFPVGYKYCTASD